MVPKSVGEAYKAAIPGAKLVTFSGSGHRPEIEATDAFLNELRGFLG